MGKAIEEKAKQREAELHSNDPRRFHGAIRQIATLTTSPPKKLQQSAYTNSGTFKKGSVDEMTANSPLTNMTNENVLVYIMERLVEAFPEEAKTSGRHSRSIQERPCTQQVAERHPGTLMGYSRETK